MSKTFENKKILKKKTKILHLFSFSFCVFNLIIKQNYVPMQRISLALNKILYKMVFQTKP